MMKRLALRDSSNSVSDVVSRRLGAITAQWLPSPAPVHPFDADDTAATTAPFPEPTTTDQHPKGLLLADRISLRALLLIGLVGAVVVGWLWWQGRPLEVVAAPTTVVEGGAPLASGAAGDPTVAANGSQVVVHVTGLVKKPGLVRLPSGSRVDDAIEAVGGARNSKALASVNLARVLVDGEQIIVGTAPESATGTATSTDGRIAINSATAAELEELPGVGPVLAERIVQWRTANGPFRSVDELSEVSGIGDSVLAQIQQQARV